MKLNFAEIFEGWRNLLIPPSHLKESIRQVSVERLSICETCEFNSKNAPRHMWITRVYEHCLECGCPLQAKTRCLSCGCGLHKWEPVLTEEEEETLNIECDGTDEGEITEDSPEAIDRDVDGRI